MRACEGGYLGWGKGEERETWRGIGEGDGEGQGEGKKEMYFCVVDDGFRHYGAYLQLSF